MNLSTWQNCYKDSTQFIIQASSMNEDDAWMPFPIGMGYHYVAQMSKGQRLQHGQHDQLLLCSITPTTDYKRRAHGKNRRTILNTLYLNAIRNTFLQPDIYFETLPSYKFVLSPEGNGIDCHRHYEALMAGCIPIMERNPLVEEKYRGCPILWTTDYSEITHDYLNNKYEEMKSRVYDFSRLFIGFYPPRVQSEIKQCGNYWMIKLTGRPIYT
uniref:Exostosin GT47 domain-containing protein n=1 Tax=viral metagenome TaxID=1070528 RepID=A0A6C0AJT1_9ZZZZ